MLASIFTCPAEHKGKKRPHKDKNNNVVTDISVFNEHNINTISRTSGRSPEFNIFIVID